MVSDTQSTPENNCQCECGKSKFDLNTQPLLRFKCHCKICQSVYQAPYSDFVIVKREDVDFPKLTGVQFKKHKSVMAVDRGTCPSCLQPVISWSGIIPGLPLAMIPSANLAETIKVPEVDAHIFYGSRVEEANDSTPKFDGYISSEWHVFSKIMKTLRK